MERVVKSLTNKAALCTVLAVLALAVLLPAFGQESGKKAPAKPETAGEPPEKKSGDDKQQDKKEGDAGGEKEKDNPPTFKKEQIEKAYPVGEKLTYNVSWSGIHAGTAVLEVKDKVRYKGRECFRIRSYTDSAKGVSLLYTVKDRLQTYVDAQTLEPMRSDQKMREGGHRKEQYVIYDNKKRTAKYHKKKEGKFVLRLEHTNVPHGIQGALTSIYYLRTMDLELGKSYSMSILTGRRITKGVFTVAEKKRMKISDLGRFNAVKIAPKYIEVPGQGRMKPGEGLFVASGDSEVWLDEDTGMPLLMIVDIPVGSIRVELSKKEKLPGKK